MKRTGLLFRAFACIMAICSLGPVCMAVPSAAEVLAGEIFTATGVKGGLIVHLNSGDGELAAALGAGEKYLVHGLDPDLADVGAAQTYIDLAGVYGRVSVQQYDFDSMGTLPYIDNLVNLVVSEVPLSGLAMAEVLRVLAPESVAYISDGGGGWTMTVKPRPANIDEWRQYLRDSDNNAVAQDTVVGPPRHLQWTSGPAWTRAHMGISTVVCVVSSKGRLFSIEDRAPVENPFLPGDFKLIARDAFNGIELWRHDLTDWECITRYIKDMTVQLQRRLAAIGDTVYCTPGLSEPVKAFDAATGTIIKTFAGTEHTQEFAYHGGVLYLVIGNRMNADRYDIVKLQSTKGTSMGGTDPNYSFDGCGFDVAYTPEVPDIVGPVCDIVAVDAATGTELWRQSGIVNYVACTLAIRGSNLAYQTQGGLFCLNPADGVERWSVVKAITSLDGTQANTLVLSDTAVYANEGGSVFAYSLADGTAMWNAAVSQNYEKSADIFITGGKLWTGGKGQPKSYDLLTGVQIDQFPQVKNGPMGHDRCYRNFITEKYFINSKTGGIDLLLLSDGTELPNYWVRGTCGFGILPCNGLMYSGPYSCQCSIEVMMKNFNAFYAEPGLTSSDDPVAVATADRLETGPAYNYFDAGYIETGWPTYRSDGKRSGSTDNYIPAAGLSVSWEFEVKTTPSAPTIEDGKVFVADIDAHTVYALNASDGTELWRYVATGRVDSPPTYYKGLVMFGSRDGWVYCVKADTGELSWRFNGLPEKRMCAFGQLESPWPVEGSVLVKDGVVYFSAGRNSFVDGGIFLFGLDPQTGSVVHRNSIYGPFEADGFPTDDRSAFKSDMLLTDGTKIYMRHKAFNANLNTTTNVSDHIIATCGMLDGGPQHRTYWALDDKLQGKTKKGWGEMLVLEGSTYYQMRGFPVHRHSYFDPRLRGYELTKSGAWTSYVPVTTKSMVASGDAIFVAGNPVEAKLDYDRDDLFEEVAAYTASYKGQLGGLLWAVSKADGSKLAEYSLDAPPVWNGMAVADGGLYISLANGKIVAFRGSNYPPGIDIGPAREVIGAGAALLDATVLDDGFPLIDPGDPCSLPIGVTYGWSKVSGPGSAIFGDANSVDTNVTFSGWGDYTIRLSAFDGSLSLSEDLDVKVLRPGDMDGDDDVDESDLELFGGGWMLEGCNELNEWCSRANQTASGTVGSGSLAVIGANWLLGVYPSAPAGLAATGGNGIASLNWDDNTEPDMDGYNVYRSDTSGSGYVKINSSLVVTSDYVDSTVVNLQTYYYVVTAVDTSAYESAYSGQASASPFAAVAVMKMVAGLGVTTDGSGNVTLWADQAGSNDASQSDVASMPQYVASGINGLPAISFDGTGQHLDVASSTDLNTGDSYPEKTLVIVFQTSSDVTTRQVIWKQGGAVNGLNFYIDSGLVYINGWTSWGPTLLNTTVLPNTVYVATMVIDSANTVFQGFVNGGSIGSFTPITEMSTHIASCALGHNESKSNFHSGASTSVADFNGLVAEFCQFNDALSTADRTALENDLKSKYGISP